MEYQKQGVTYDLEACCNIGVVILKVPSQMLQGSTLCPTQSTVKALDPCSRLLRAWLIPT